jgi:hypothetical protein
MNLTVTDMHRLRNKVEVKEALASGVAAERKP